MYGDTEKSSPKDENQVVCHSVRSRLKERTDEMPALFYDPSCGTVEPMVVTRGEVDNAEEKGVPGPDAGSRGTSATFHGSARSHLSRDFDGITQVLSEALGVYHRRVGRLAEA